MTLDHQLILSKASLSSYEINHKNLDDLSGFIQSQKRIGFELEPQLVCQLREAAKDMLKICKYKL